MFNSILSPLFSVLRTPYSVLKSSVPRPPYSVLIFIFLMGCSTDQSIQVDLEKSRPEQLLSFYFGSYVGNDGGDPFEAGLLVEKDGAYWVNREMLEGKVAEKLDDVNGDGVIKWDELEPFLQKTYYQVRPGWESLDALETEWKWKGESANTMEMELHGVMTTARRHIYVDKAAVREALQNYEANGEQLLYPGGTVFIGEHLEEGKVVETTVMKKRDDDFWDYYVFDAAGNRVSATSTPPKTLNVPTRCVGCHFGSKKFEPENSYPHAAAPGIHGPRTMYREEVMQDTSLVKLFDEHNKRSDTILGLYATIYLSDLKKKVDAGESLEEVDLEIWQKVIGD